LLAPDQDKPPHLRLLARLQLGRLVQTFFQEHVMSSISINNESLSWMTAVGIPPEDVLYLRRMATYGGYRVESVRVRIKEIQDAAYEGLLAVSMLCSPPSALAQ
jgi:hypothetical protein